MKKKLLFIVGFFVAVATIGIKPASATLSQYYYERGAALPSCADRVKIATEYGMESYDCRKVADNNFLENKLRSSQNQLIGFSVVSRFKTTLSSSMSSSQTTVPVASVNTFDGTTLTMSLLGGKVFLTIEPGSTREEIVKCTNISALQFTGCTRGLAFSGTSEAAVPANQKAHNAASVVVMSNVHYVYDQLADKDSTEDVGGVKRFTSSTIKIGDGATTTHKTITADNGTSNLPFVRYNETVGRWQFSDDGTNTTNLTTSSAAGLAASSSLGIGISDSLIYINASSTTGVAFGSDGKLYQKVSSTLAVASDSNGIYIVTSTLVNLIATSTPGANIIPISTASSTLNDNWINTSTLAGTISTIQNFTAGESINASSVPQAVYFSNNDNTVHKLTSATASSTIFDFVGFAILGQNVATSSIIKVQTAGLVDGFSSLVSSSYYYGTDTAGTVSTTAGTISYQIGLATKNTQILIRKGRKTYNGTATFSATATSVVTIGFKPSRVRVSAVMGTNMGSSSGGWSVNGGNNCVYVDNSPAAGASGSAWYVQGGGAGTSHTGTVTTLTNAGFTLSNTKAGSPGNVSVFWEAED